MRCTLVHWLIKVSQQLQFGAETVFVAVGLSDRFLATTPLAQDCLQLLALCSLFVAAKMVSIGEGGCGKDGESEDRRQRKGRKKGWVVKGKAQ